MPLLLHVIGVVFQFLLSCPLTLATNFSMGLGPSVIPYLVGDLPDVQYKLPLSWAGQIHIPNNKTSKLFFWLFEAETQSNNLIIWLNGGPGCSSLGGLAKENGPLFFPNNNSSPHQNPYSWTKLANVLYIDQPIGTGFATGESLLESNAEITDHFFQWLKEFFKEFPVLKSKKIYLMGESYAGIYIPYFTQAILANRKTLNINLISISIGDGSFGNIAAQTDVAITRYLHEQNHILKVPDSILNAFDVADRHCSFAEVLDQLKYPPQGKISIPGNPEGDNYKRQEGCTPNSLNTPAEILRSVNDLCYGGCATWSTANKYLGNKNPCWSMYNIGYNCQNAPTTDNFVNYFNRPDVQKAIHAPKIRYEACNAELIQGLTEELVAPPAYHIMPAIIEQGIPIHIYSGGRDFLFNHIGTELVIQNMTWGDKQGLQSPPNHKFYVNGRIVGNWGSERGLSYHHIANAGHVVPYDQPAIAFAYVRDFVIGNGGSDC